MNSPLIQRLIDYIQGHGIYARQAGDLIEAEDTWTYRDTNNKVRVASEWRTIEPTTKAVREFLGY